MQIKTIYYIRSFNIFRRTVPNWFKKKSNEL